MRKYDMNDIENDIPQNAVSVYGPESTMDEFPILKAFQEYINAEQAKARKRITALAVFFGVLLIALLAIFTTLLVKSYDDNQQLNDRLVQYVVQDRERADREHAEREAAERDRIEHERIVREKAVAEAVAKAPPKDSAAVIELTKKIEELQEKIYASQRKADDAERARAEQERKVAEQQKLMAEKDKQMAEKMAEKDKQAAEALKKAIEDAKPKGPSAEEQEIARLKALLAAEKQKQAAAVEKERRRQEELEAYRRKHYPEHYRPKTTPSRPLTIGKIDTSKLPQYDDDEDLDDLPDEGSAISYYDDEPKGTDPKVSRGQTPKPKGTVPKKSGSVPLPKPQPAAKETEEKFTIPVEVRKSNDISIWDIPED